MTIRPVGAESAVSVGWPCGRTTRGGQPGCGDLRERPLLRATRTSSSLSVATGASPASQRALRLGPGLRCRTLLAEMAMRSIPLRRRCWPNPIEAALTRGVTSTAGEPVHARARPMGEDRGRAARGRCARPVRRYHRAGPGRRRAQSPRRSGGNRSAGSAWRDRLGERSLARRRLWRSGWSWSIQASAPATWMWPRRSTRRPRQGHFPTGWRSFLGPDS